jgi:hypothetical protein
MAAKKKPSAAQLAARAKFVAMVRAKSKAKKSATKKATVKKSAPKKAVKKKVAKKKVSGLDKVVRRGTKTNVHYSRISGIGLNDIGLELLDLERKIIGLKSKKKSLKSVKDKKEIQGKITIYNNQFKYLKGYLNTRAKFI